ncbi:MULTISPECIES: EAL domain-containing protein [Pseudomonas]|nr:MULTISPECIES: EAL domain-containing protein [Pseudomonas]
MSSADVGVPTHVLVELSNYAHLEAAYGEAFAVAAMGRLQWCVHMWGGSVFVIGPQCFLVGLSPSLLEVKFSRSLIERWQWALSTTPLDFGGVRALPVVVVESLKISASVGLTEGRLRYPDELERPNAAHPLPPVRVGKGWSVSYERDMEVALTFYRALEQGQASLVFQPINQRGGSGAVLYQEALLRLSTQSQRPSFGPAQFVPALERLGLIRVLDYSVLSAVVSRLEVDPTAKLGCNLSALSLSADSWWESILARLAAQPDVALRLTIEITETMPLVDIDAACAFVRRLKGVGCRIALDDFGAGQSSLAFAHAVRPEVIKIDSSFLHDARMDHSEFDQLYKLVAFCQTLAPYVVVEGIERANDVELAAMARIGWLQGNYIDPPSSAKPPVRICVLDAEELGYEYVKF